MLKHLSIQNYALIAQLEMNFEQGFSVITGETGAGKSIILGALALALGQRVDSKTIKENADKCVIEVYFDIKEYALHDFFENNELDYDETCIIRREILSNGKSRSFVNDTPITLTALKELGAQLIDIHSQHENLLLSNPLFQLTILDIVAKNNNMLANYQAAFKTFIALTTELETLVLNAEKYKTEKDYLQFQFSQLEEAHLQKDEQTELEEELELLTHSEEIKAQLEKAKSLLQQDEQGILPSLKETINAIKKITSFLPSEKETEERLSSCYIELKDIVQEVETKQLSVDFDPQRQEYIQQRLDLIYSLQKKHKATSIDELLVLKDSFEKQLSRIESFDDEILALQKRVEETKTEVQNHANTLSKTRQNVIPDITHIVSTQLQQLGIPHVQFSITITQKQQWSLFGNDDVQFLFSSNKHTTPMPVSQIASGGEVSRLMLCLKALIANTSTLPTIIFDEIDTGVSGEIADKMGEIMKQMSASIQVISITHLPQIAAKGNKHYKVFKKHEEKSTSTHIKKLTEQERIQEIAQMLSGSTLTEAAIKNAEALLFPNN
jgi:DNA repair protein RecN (Recombination protein N)